MLVAFFNAVKVESVPLNLYVILQPAANQVSS